jgi:NADPH2:quinone reductase
MRAIVIRAFGEPGVLQIEDVPVPTIGANQVLVRMRTAGVNPVDTYLRAGAYARKPALPFTPGWDGAGEIEAVGSDVQGFGPGDRVYVATDNVAAAGAGTYAEYAACAPAQLHPLPARVSFAQGAAIGIPYATAYRALFHRAHAKPGDTVLVHGATGGTGLAGVELAHAHGMRVIGTGGTDAGLHMVREHGADVVVNHRDPAYLTDVMTATGGRGVDVVLEMAAHLNLDRDLTVLAPGGRVVVIGSRGRIEIDPRLTMGRDAAVLGVLIFNTPTDALAEIHAALVAGLSQGTLNPVVGREFVLGEAPRAHEAVLQPGAFGKIVLAT